MGNKPVILQSFPAPRPTTNPYLIMLADSLMKIPDTEVRNFSWRTALVGKFDVFHVHWPEILVSGKSPSKKLVRQLLFLIFLARLRLTKTPIVRTVHNIDLPQGISRREESLLKIFDKRTDLRIILNGSTRLPSGQPFELIEHGHYRDWFKPYTPTPAVPGRIGYFGLIRRYKNVEGLVTAFNGVSGAHPDLSLAIGGKPSSTELASSLVDRSKGNPKVFLSLHFLTDEELVSIVTSAELIVLPYREMHNSGGALTALSLNRPVLLPDNAVNRELKVEVGARWVHLYAENISGDEILNALEAIQGMTNTDTPDLSLRNWDLAGSKHISAYRRAAALRHHSQVSVHFR